MIYSSSPWTQALGHRLGSKFAISTASSNRWAGADQRKADAIREFTKGVVVEDGLFRDKDNPQTITKKAFKNMPVLIEYQNQRPIRPTSDSALSQQFKGSFCKVYLPDKDGSFPKGERGWWIEDVKIQDTKTPGIIEGAQAQMQGQRAVYAPRARATSDAFGKTIILKGPNTPSEKIDLNRYTAYRVCWGGPDDAKAVFEDGTTTQEKFFGTKTGKTWFQGPAGATVRVVFTPR